MLRTMSHEDWTCLGFIRFGDKSALKIYLDSSRSFNTAVMRSNLSANHYRVKPYVASKRKGHATNDMRTIEIGWMMCTPAGMKKVAAKEGRGIRNNCHIPGFATITEVQQTVVALFFEGGISSKGSLDKFNLNMVRFDGKPLFHLQTIDETITQLKMKVLRVYLSTTPKHEEVINIMFQM